MGGLTPISEPDTSTNESLKLSQSDHLKLIHRFKPELRNKTLIVCVVIREPFVIFNEPSNWANLTSRERKLLQQDLDNYSGVAIAVVKRLRWIFKFNIRIIRPSDNQFGVYVPGLKRWTGLMGVLDAKQADIGVTALSITVGRAQAIDFTRAYYVETVTILIKTPEEVQNYLAIFNPFSLLVWLVLLATIVLLIALITIMTKLEDNQRKHEKMHKLAKFLERRASLSADLIGDDQSQQSRDGHERKAGSASSSTLGNRLGVGVDLWPVKEDGEEAGQGQDQREQELRARSTKRRYSVKQLNERLSELNRTNGREEEHEFGDSWLERFYYAVTCVINILLIRGKFLR